MQNWPIVILAVGSLGAVVASLSALYSRLLPAASWWRSFGVSAGCAVIGAATWLIVVPVVMPVAVTDLFVPIGMMAAVASTLASLSIRGGDPRAWVVFVFAAAWSLVVFVPVATATFVTGILGIMPVDHGGSLLLNVAAGAAAAGVLLLRVRSERVPVLSVPRWASAVALAVVAGAWLTWLVAAELAFDEVSLTTLGNGILGAAGGMIGWLGVQRIRHQSTTLAAMAAGLVSGLVAVTAGAPLFSPVAAVSVGVLASVAACLVTIGRVVATGSPQWYIVGTHGVAGAVGIVLLGLVATGSGFLFTGQFSFIQDQALSVIVVGLYSGGVALLLWLLLGRWAMARRTRA